MLGVDEDSDPEFDVEALTKYEDVFLDRKEQIIKSLDHITSEPLTNNESDIIRYLNISLSGVGEPDEEFENAMITYLKMIMTRDQGAADRLLEHDAKEEFVEFVLDSIIDYGKSLQRLNFKETQGENWWSFVDLDRVIKNDTIRHHHKITIDTTDTVEIHSTPQSDWTLARHMLDSVYESYRFTGELEPIIDIAVFEQVRAYIYSFENELETAGVELRDRDELIESPDENKEDNV